MMEIKLVIFYVGLFFLLRILFRLILTVKSIFFGVPVTTERYGKDSWAVVTGCTEGIGKAVALELASREFNLVLISRNVTKLEVLAKEIQERFRRDTRIIVFDFSKEMSLTAYADIKKKIQDLDISVLINNVGIAQGGQILQLSPNDILKETVVNCYPIVLLTHQLINSFQYRFEKKGLRSFIGNLASLASIHPLPYLANYAATKKFDDAFAKGLYYELKSKGIDILSVQPGLVASHMNNAQPSMFNATSSESTAKAVLNNANSFICGGGLLHDVRNYIIRSVILDHVPKWAALRIWASIGNDFTTNESSKPILR